MNPEFYHRRLKKAGITSREERCRFIKFLEFLCENREQRRELFDVIVAGVIFNVKLEKFRVAHPGVGGRLRGPEPAGVRLVEGYGGFGIGG